MTETSETADNGRFFALLAAGVACGKTIRSAAEEIDCSERQAYRISALPEFKSRVSELRSEITSEAVGKLTSAATQAADTMTELLSPTNEPSVRLNASKAILNALGPISDLGELRSRIEALERGE